MAFVTFALQKIALVDKTLWVKCKGEPMVHLCFIDYSKQMQSIKLLWTLPRLKGIWHILYN